MNKNIVKYGLILFIITAVSTGLVSIVYNITEPIITQQQIEKDNNSRKLILPDATEFVKVEKEYLEPIIEVYEGKNQSGETVGYTIKTATKGYGGPVEVTTGITVDGVINAVSMGSLTETPGLGAKAEDEAFYGQYAGKDVTEIKVVKGVAPKDDEIAAISGATITSNAVTLGVNSAVELYNTDFQ